MRFLFGLFFLLFFAAFILTGALWLLYRVFSGMGFNLSDKATDNLVRRLRAHLTRSRETLVPWEPDMLTLLSLNRQDERKANIFGRPASGVYSTIYHEPVLAYAWQKAGKVSLLLAQTSDKEFVFRKKSNETEIWINGRPLGIFINGALLEPGSKSKLLGRLDQEPAESQFALELLGKPAASLHNPKRAGGPNPRALTLLRDLSPEEENAVLALAILEMVRE